jgi:hypothetical protein
MSIGALKTNSEHPNSNLRSNNGLLADAAAPR